MNDVDGIIFRYILFTLSAIWQKKADILNWIPASLAILFYLSHSLSILSFLSTDL